MATALTDDTPQSITIRECYTVLINQLKSSIESLGDALYAKGLISPDIHSKVLLTSIVPANKAREVFSYLIERVKHDPNAYNGFIEVLIQNGRWTEPVVKKLEATLAYKQSHFHETQSTPPFSAETAHTPIVQPLHRDTQDDISASYTKRIHSLEAQQMEYEKQVIQLKEKLVLSRSTSSSAGTSYNREKEWEEVNPERLGDILTQAKKMVQEANLLLESFDKDIELKVVLAVPHSLLSSRQTPNVDTSDAVMVRVLHKQKGSESVWSVDTLQEKLVILRDMAKRKGEGAQLDDNLPFNDLEQPTLLGLANFSLVGLKHNVTHEYSAPIVTATGEEGGHLKVIIERCSRQCTHGEDSGLCPGDSITFQINVLEATGMSKDYRHCVFCQYQFQGENIKIQSNLEKSSLSSRFQTFQHNQVFRVTVDEDFLDIVNNGALSIEVWGRQQENTEDVSRGLGGVTEGAKRKGGGQHSVTDELRGLAKRLEVWVEIEELNEQGEYVPVAMRNKPEVITGGVFKIRQGHSQKINVTVHTVPESGNGLLSTNNISSVSLGSIDLCSSNDRPLDSFQSYDLERLCDRWGNDLQRCQEHLDDEYRKLDSHQNKQKQLYAHRYMVVSQRDDVLQLKKVTSELPGACTDWREKSGFECKVPILFLDDPSVSDDSMETMFLCGEREESMLDLKIIKRHEDTERVQATTLWDVAAHNTDDLNKVTQDGYRVYAILKVGVALYHPPDVVLELRKRICMKVYNRTSALSAFKRSINANRPGCGVMYDVVVGVPKTRGMKPPPIIQPNPSLIELQDGEDPVERLKTALTSIDQVLSLDKLKQEVSLKEKLSEAGQRKRLDSVGALSRKKHSPINGDPVDKRFVFELSQRSQSLSRSKAQHKQSRRYSFKF